MKKIFKKLKYFLIIALVLVSLTTVVSADNTVSFWQKQGNGQLYTNTGNGFGNAIINVGGCNGCMTGPGQIPLANTHILVGNVSGDAADVALTLSGTGGAFSLANTGALTMPNANGSTRGLLLSADWTTFNNKQNALGFTPENVANKSTDVALGTSNTLYPTQNAVKTYADGLVVGLLDDRGSYDASTNLFPSTGGSGTAGAILKGDIWYISVAGTLGGTLVNVGDNVRALVDTPGQTAGNWSILNVGLGYVPLSRTLTDGHLFVGNASNIAADAGTGIFYDNSNSRLGLGTTTPTELLDVNGASVFRGVPTFREVSPNLVSTASDGYVITSYDSTASGGGGQNVFRRADGTEATPTNLKNDMYLGGLSFRGYTGSAFTGSKGFMAFRAAEDWTPTANGTDFEISTTPIGTTTLLQRLVVLDSGNVGIGTAAPLSIFHTSVTSETDGATRWLGDSYSTTQPAGFIGRRARGTAGSPTAAQSGDYLTSIAGRGYGATTFGSTSTGSFNLQATENFTDSAKGTKATIRTTDNGSTTQSDKVTVLGNGNVGIGTTNPSALLSLGTAGTKAGTLSLAGVTSGVVTLQTAAAAGTYTLTLPTSDGNANQFLKTDGSGVLSWDNVEMGLTFAQGLTRTGDTVRNNLITGLAGGQTIVGGTDSGDALTLFSNAFGDGKIFLGFSGGSYYDEALDTLVIGNTTQSTAFDAVSSYNFGGNRFALLNGLDYDLYNSDNNVIASIKGNSRPSFSMGSARFQESQGADVASANDLTLGADGNTFVITGTTQINRLDSTDWQPGATVTFLFSGILTVKDAQGSSGAFLGIHLNGSADLITVNGTVLKLTYIGTRWVQTSPVTII